MAEFSLRPKAITDLDEIWDYTVETWGEEQAERYLRSITKAFERLLTTQASGVGAMGFAKATASAESVAM